MSYIIDEVKKQAQEIIDNQWDWHPDAKLPNDMTLCAFPDGIWITDGNCIMDEAVKIEFVCAIPAYETIISNVGTSYSGNSKEQAEIDFNYLVECSKYNYGRMSGESVTMFCNGEIIQEYTGANENE